MRATEIEAKEMIAISSTVSHLRTIGQHPTALGAQTPVSICRPLPHLHWPTTRVRPEHQLAHHKQLALGNCGLNRQLGPNICGPNTIGGAVSSDHIGVGGTLETVDRLVFCINGDVMLTEQN